MRLIILGLLISVSASAQNITLKNFNWTLTDVSSKNLSKESLFSRMDRDFIKTGSSICSNRALMWANNFKEQHNLDTGKIFLFYTKKKGDVSLKTWWYHVAPVVNEKGNIWVMDAGFPGFIKGPLTSGDWLQKFADSRNCKEIQHNETDLVEFIFNGVTFPHRTDYGYYDCYYLVVPHTLWTPEIVAMNILGKDSNGRAVRVERHEIEKDELYQACLEATTSKFGYAVGSGKKKCKEYAGIED